MAISTKEKRLRMETLEDRTMFDGGWTSAVLELPTYDGGDYVLENPEIPAAVAVPAYSSKPDAPAAIYLDFNGNLEKEWSSWTNAITPVFDLDGDSSEFSKPEMGWIYETWQHVAEDYAPFNINVTTVDPGDFTNGNAVRVAIGGATEDWYYTGDKGSQSFTGVGLYNGFTNGYSNTVYVFPYGEGTLRLKNPAELAGTSSHEAGHAFGLSHQSLLDADGKVIDEYRDGTSEVIPIMGGGDHSIMSRWSSGTASRRAGTDEDGNIILKTFQQNDMLSIASTINGFGFRADDHADNYQDAEKLGSISYGAGKSQGVIEQTYDIDWFSFSVAKTANVEVNVQVAAVGANLDPQFYIYTYVTSDQSNSVEPVLIAFVDPSDSLDAKRTVELSPGTYYVRVSGHRDYGDVGQYTISAKAISTGLQIGDVGKFEKTTRTTFRRLRTTAEEPTSELTRLREVVAQPTTLTRESRTLTQTSPVAEKTLAVASDDSYEAAADELFSRDTIELFFAPSRWRRF